MIKWWRWLDLGIERLSTWLLVSAVTGIFLLSLFGIVARWLQVAPVWIDPLIRHLVFVSAFLAGILITGCGKHLHIDLLYKYLEQMPRMQTAVERVIAVTSFLAMIWLTHASLAFLSSEIEFGRPHFLGIHSSVWAAVMPIGFSLMGYRFLYLFIRTFAEDASC